MQIGQIKKQGGLSDNCVIIVGLEVDDAILNIGLADPLS
jgi:hypothetical protein